MSSEVTSKSDCRVLSWEIWRLFSRAESRTVAETPAHKISWNSFWKSVPARFWDHILLFYIVTESLRTSMRIMQNHWTFGLCGINKLHPVLSSCSPSLSKRLLRSCCVPAIITNLTLKGQNDTDKFWGVMGMWNIGSNFQPDLLLNLVFNSKDPNNKGTAYKVHFC